MYVNRKEKTPQYNVFKLNTTLTNFPQCQLKKIIINIIYFVMVEFMAECHNVYTE